MRVFGTDYAADLAAGRQTDPVWSYQSPSGMITIAKETDGSAYQQQRCVPGNNWNGMQRADCLTNLLNSYMQEGGEWAVRFKMKLAPNFTAPNPGWCVGGAEVHDVRGAVGAAMLAAQDFAAGRISAEELASAMEIARHVAGAEHLSAALASDWSTQVNPYTALASVGTQANISMLVSENGLQLRVLGGDISTTTGAPVNSADTFYSQRFQFARDVYHDVVFYCFSSADRTRGHVRLMIDGQIVVDKVCATIYTGSSGYLKQPFYRDPNQSANVDTWIRYEDMDAYGGPGCWLEAAGSDPAPPTNAELRDQAVAHLQATTITYPSWLQRVAQGRYNPPDGSGTEWGKAFAALDKIT